MQPCTACAAAKAKQKSVPKESDHVPVTGDACRVFLDISTIKKPNDLKTLAKPNWRIMVDERTQMKFSGFYEKKNHMVDPTCVKLNKWKQAGKTVKFIRMGNAGTNLKLQKRGDSADWKLAIDYEFTARDLSLIHI